ncbi:MAG: ATP-binding protein [Coprothermobacterota bacterium]|nr:ATP-binding protein [Coprothermobacterota bacterium]
MKIGQKILLSFFLIGGIPLIALALAVYFLNSHVLLEAEVQHLVSSLSTMDSFLKQEKSALETTLEDYAVWSDHYQALLERKDAWIEENVTSWVPQHFGMELVILWDRFGKTIGYAGDPASLDSRIRELALTKALGQSQFFSGFERLGPSLAIFASGPVLTNEGKGPPAGALLFVRCLKPEDLSLFESEGSFPLLLVGNDLQVSEKYSQTPQLSEIKSKVGEITANSGYLLLSQGAIFTSKALLNPEGKVIGYLGFVSFAQEVAQARKNTIIFSLIVGCGFLGLVVLASGFLYRWLLAPLNTLSQNLRSLFSGKRIEERKWPRDQVGALASSLMELYRESQEARQKAEAENVWFRGILDSSHDILLIFDSQGRLADANKAAEVFFSTSKKQFLGLEPEEALKRLNIEPETLSSRFWDGLKEAYSSGKETVYEGYFASLDRQVIVSFLPLFLEKELKGVILSIKDVTALRKSELERRALLEGVAHDLGSPITSLFAAVELMKKGCDSPQAMSYLNGMENNLLLMKNLVQNLVNLNRLEAGMVRLEQAPIDLCQFLERMRLMFQPLIQSRRLTLAIECPENLPPLYADPVRLEEIFSNLFSNSVKHTPPSGLILISLGKIDTTIKIRFQDTGYGIPEEEMNFVFQRFRQGEMGRKAGGSGLGLYITKSLVELMGGTITLQSEKGKGTTVEISFPLNQQVNG